MDRNEFKKGEYTALKAEILERIRIINSQAANAIVTILTTWSMAIAFTVICYSKEVIKEPVSRLILENIKNMLFLIPILFFIPLSVKSGENLRQLASLSAYIKVFFEYPLIKARDAGWETFNSLLSDISVYKGSKSNLMKRYNGEYSILATISLLIFIANVVSTYYIVREGGYLSQESICMWKLIYGLVVVVMLVCIGAIHRSSCARKNLMDMAAFYLGGYIEVAKKRRLLEGYDYDEVYKMLKPNGEVNRKDIINKVKEKWGYKFSRFM